MCSGIQVECNVGRSVKSTNHLSVQVLGCSCIQIELAMRMITKLLFEFTVGRGLWTVDYFLLLLPTF